MSTRTSAPNATLHASSDRSLSVCILGSGNIGTDLLYKVRKDPVLDIALVSGIDPESPGLARAADLGYETSTDGIRAVLAKAASQPVIVFDATSARAHVEHAQALGNAGITVIDLTPAGIGPMVFPTVNLDSHADALNINLVSCAAQATVPIVAAVRSVVPTIGYVETVSTVASRSAGPGTRQNIDEFTHKTTKALTEVGGAEQAKAIALLNPAEPPLMMRNTIYMLTEGTVDEARVTNAVETATARIQGHVPGYQVRGPVFEDPRITVFTEISGAGDYLPPFAGNLDIMTSAAVAVARRIAASMETKA